MKAFVVDTNVPVAANGKAEQAGPECVLACIDALQEARDRGRIVLDDGMPILEEYMSNLSMSGQPGPDDAFMKWVWAVQGVAEQCEQVHLAPCADEPTDYEEFPQDKDLGGFDRSDRKFVAVALASRSHPAILNATDSDWWIYGRALARHGVYVRNLCPDLMEFQGRTSRCSP